MDRVDNVVKVRVVSAKALEEDVPGQFRKIVRFGLQLLEPIVLENGQPIEEVYAGVPNEDSGLWSVGVWRQASLRYALDLDPFFLANASLTVPHFTPSELRDILGKVIRVELVSVPYATRPERLHPVVRTFMRLGLLEQSEEHHD